MVFVGAAAVLVLLVELACYTVWIPDVTRRPARGSTLDERLGTAAYAFAYVLSVLRAPLGLLPYLTKLCIVFALRIPCLATRSSYRREALNLAGDAANLALSTALVARLAGPPRPTLLSLLLYVPLGAEVVRLLTERVPLLFSAVWQFLPHRAFARLLRSHRSSGVRLARYCRYYALSDTARAAYLLRALKRRAAYDEDLARRLAYIGSFRIVPRSHSLRGGWVRDVARGEVFIHACWIGDPWLLAGLAIRRAPWMFDPRYLRRPCYYMSEANRLATLAVLRHARYCPPYAVFQFGHEIRVARLHLFYSLLRRIGIDVEEKVSADGTFQPDQLIRWLEDCVGRGDDTLWQPPLCTDDQAIADLLRHTDADAAVTAQEIAARYTYPLAYVEEVLQPALAIERQRRQARLAATC